VDRQEDAVTLPERQTIFSERQMSVLVAVARAMYPHPGLGDAPYERVVATITEQAGDDPKLAEILRAGIEGISPCVLYNREPAALEAKLRDIERFPFFQTLRPLVAWHLYDDDEVREFVGYPGPSYDQGGYVERGFDDLDWLPDPQIEEPDEALVEVGQVVYLANRPSAS
jgi:hypothetical protein